MAFSERRKKTRTGLIRLLVFLRLLRPANFRHSFSYVKKFGLRLCCARIVYLLLHMVGCGLSGKPFLTFQPPKHKFRVDRRQWKRGATFSPPPLAGCRESLRLDLAAIKDTLAQRLGSVTKFLDDPIHTSVATDRGATGEPSDLIDGDRLLRIAEQSPERLSESLRVSRFYLNGDLDLLYYCLLQAVARLAECHGETTMLACVRALEPEVVTVFGLLSAHNFFSQLELMLGLRRMRVGIYDHSFHFAGGAQRYVAFMAEEIQSRYEVTYIANKDAALEQYKEWYNIDLSKCSIKVIKIPFFEQFCWPFIDPGMASFERTNPFDIISQESLNYDTFVNANMLGKVQPLSPTSVFFCHFPDQERERFFAVDQYDYLVSNSRYTAGWIKRKWGVEATHLIYPPVEMGDAESDPEKKEPVILSVARFEQTGSKKQMEMAKAFIELAGNHPVIRQRWKLILAGGNPVENPYFKKIKKLAENANCTIELRTNLNYDEIKALYRSSSIFWHACGLDEIDPRLIEHFGMTTVEAMQNFCVPIVIRGGGQVEIVQDGISGFTFGTIGELQSHTIEVINNKDLRIRIAKNAYQRSQRFNGRKFRARVTSLFSQIENSLIGVDVLSSSPRGAKTHVQ